MKSYTLSFQRAAFLLLGSLALFACSEDAPPEPEVRPVRTLTIASYQTGQAISLVGTVQAENEVNQSFRISGRLIERAVGVGDSVRAGQLIARLDALDEETSLQSARAQLAAALAQSIEAENHFERMRDLVAENAVSQSQFDQAEANRAATASRVESAQSQVVLAQNRVSYTRLESSVSGVVTMQGAEPGEVVAAGSTIVQVAREDARDAVFDVPAVVKDSATADSPITIVLGSDPSVTASGRVREVSPRADPVTGTFRVRVAITDPPDAMRLGTTVTGRLQLTDVASTHVPATAVVRSDRRTAVWVVDPASSAVSLRDIEIQSSDSDRVVVASGLNPGDVIVIAGVHALRPGQKVRVAETRQ